MKMLSIIVLASSLLSACNYAPQTGDSYNRQSQFMAQSNKVYFDSFAKIPKLAIPSQYMVRLHNDSKDNYKINSAKLSATVQNSTNNATLDNNECVELLAGSQCGFIVDFPANNSASYSLSVEVENSKHQRQIIKTALIADEVREDQGGINYSLPTRVSSHNGNYHLAIPVYFSQDFESIDTSNGDLYCRNGYHSGSNCTYYIDGYTSKDNLILTTLNGTKDDQSEVKSSERVFVTKDNTKFPWIVLSAPQDVEQDDANHTTKTVITVFNSGEGDVTRHNVLTNELAQGVSLGLSTCPSIITAGAICTIEVLVNVEKNSSSRLRFDYSNNHGFGLEVGYQFLHFVNIKEPILIWDNPNSNFFENSIPNEQREKQITLTAKNISFDKITISHDNNPDFEIVGSQSRLCEGNQVTVDPLTKDESCTISIKYKPRSIQNTPNNFHFVASGTYVESNGITRTFAYPLALSYSAPFSAASYININNNTPISLSTTTDETKEVSVQLRNNANYSIKLSTPSFSPAINGATIDSAQCNSFTLAKNSTCTFKIKYAPRAPQAATSSRLQMSVVNFNGVAVSQNNLLEQTVNYSAADPTTPNLTRRLVSVTGQKEIVNGIHWLKANDAITLTYEIKNTTVNTTARNIRIPSLPAGWNSDISDCNNKTLANGQSCNVKLFASYANAGLQELKEANVTIAFQYGKGTHQANVALGAGVTKIQVFTMPSTIVVSGDIGTVNIAPGASTTTTFTIAGGYPNMPAYTVTASADTTGLIFNNSSCTLNFTTKSCSIRITIPQILPSWQVIVNFSSNPLLPFNSSSQLLINFTFGSGVVNLIATGQTATSPLNPAPEGTDGYYQEGVNIDPRFQSEGDCIIDNLTGLMWPKDANLFGKRNWGDALSAVANMNTTNGATGYNLCGYRDWHLPTVNELSSLLNYSQITLAIWLNNQGFKNVQADYYWSSTSSARFNNGGSVWQVSLNRGSVNDYGQNTFRDCVWPVRRVP